jgi:Sulfotransferase domain
MIPKRFKDINFLKRRSLEAYRVWTSSLRLQPSFLIIGAQKGGTTSLYRYLEEHPSVAGAFAKEVHFFDNHTRDYKYGKGMQWYRSHFVYGAHRHYSRLVHQQDLITGEGSPDYLFDVHAPQRIVKNLPNAKIIVLLRDPVDRAYSHYLHNARASWDPNRENLSFEDAIAAEPERLDGEYEKLLQDESYFSYNYMHYSYLKRGFYADQLKIWLQLFPQEQILILKSEDFFAQPSIAFQEVLSFLQLSSWEPKKFQLFNTRNKKSTGLNNNTKEKLKEYFYEQNLALNDLLKQDFGWNIGRQGQILEINKVSSRNPKIA